MKKDKLGTKRTCLECNAKFYDLNKDPIKCPKCGAEFAIDDFTKHTFATGAKKIKKDEVFDDETSFNDEDMLDEVLQDADDDLDVMEDTSDISDDSHDMAEVIGNLDKNGLSE